MRHRICEAESRNDPAKLVYSVPRKLDLASLFVFTMCYGILFAIMSAFQFQALSFALVAGFLTCVGFSQAVLFGGKAPRFASSITGTLYYGALFVFSPFLFGTSRNQVVQVVDVSVIIPFLVFGLAFGYLSGTCIAGIFLISDRLRMWLRPDAIRAKERSMKETLNDDGFGQPAKKETSFDEVF